MGNCCMYLFRRCLSKATVVRLENPYAITHVSDNRDSYFSKDDLIMLANKYPECFEEKKSNTGSRFQIKTLSEPIKKQKKIKWKEGEVIGHGSFGRVVSGLNLITGEIMAVKQVHIGNLQSPDVKERIKALELEVEVLSNLNHKNIVRYIGTDKTKTTLNIFLEYISGGSIATLINKYGKLNETLIRVYVKQILEGLEYLHLKGTIHRDIKGGNVLVDNHGNCKLADFGSAKHLYSLKEGNSLNSLKGTANWMAPEAIMQKDLSRFSDIWSVGCTIIEMATGRPPWSEYSSPITAMFQIAQSKRPPTLPAEMSPECIDFLKHCFRKNPKERQNVTKLLQHKFISGSENIIRNPNKTLAVPASFGSTTTDLNKIQLESVTPEITKISKIFELLPRESTDKPIAGPKSILNSNSNLKGTLQSQTISTADSKAPRLTARKSDATSLKEQTNANKNEIQAEINFHKSADFRDDNFESTTMVSKKKPTTSKKELNSKESHQIFYKVDNALKLNPKNLVLFRQADIENMPRFATRLSDQNTPPRELFEKAQARAIYLQDMKKWGHDFQNDMDLNPKTEVFEKSLVSENNPETSGKNKLNAPIINTIAATEEVIDDRIQLSEQPLKSNYEGVTIKNSLDVSISMNQSSLVNIGMDESTDNLKVKGMDQLNATLQDDLNNETSIEAIQTTTTVQKTSPFQMIFTEKFDFEVIKEENENAIGEIPRRKKKP